jgi:catechol 2,3-dioxygenase-like lactoylglutathione lyase family enzyme
MYRVLKDRQRWFGVVTGESPDASEWQTDRRTERVPLPDWLAEALAIAIPRRYAAGDSKHGQNSGMDRPSIRPQPMISVADIGRSSAWYQRVLGAASDHGGAEYERLVVDGELILQLHREDVGHHHGTIGDPSAPFGNGVAIWFEAADFDAIVANARAVEAQVQTDVHVNPNAGHREIWLRDPDGYLVVIAEP